MRQYLVRLTAFTAVALLTFNVVMLIHEDDYIFMPDRQLARTPETVGLPYADVVFDSTQGVHLHGWYIPGPTPGARIVLHLHGNAGNMSDRLRLYARWHRMGLAVFAFDYRGYGRSNGTPSENGLYDDARAAWRYLMVNQKIPPRRIVIAGRSLGAAVATHLAAHAPAGGLVLETPFTSTAAMAAYHYPFFLLRPLIRARFDTLTGIRQVHLPLLIIAAADDTIAPPGMSHRILAAANPPKRQVSLAGNHNDFDIESEKAYTAAWRGWLAGLTTGKQ